MGNINNKIVKEKSLTNDEIYINNIKIMFDYIYSKNKLNNQIIKFSIMKKHKITEEEYNKSNQILLEIKFDIFMKYNKNIPISDIYNMLYILIDCDDIKNKLQKVNNI